MSCGPAMDSYFTNASSVFYSPERVCIFYISVFKSIILMDGDTAISTDDFFCSSYNSNYLPTLPLPFLHNYIYGFERKWTFLWHTIPLPSQ